MAKNRDTQRSESTENDETPARGEESSVTPASGVPVATQKQAKNNEFANYNKPMQPVMPKDNSGIAGPVPGVDAGATFAEDTEGKIDPKLAEAATLRPAGAQGGSQTDRLTGVQQQAQGLNRKDRPSTTGAIKTGDEMVNLAGFRQGDPADNEAEQRRKGSIIRSADNRSLFVSINGNVWEGQEIYVPDEYHKEALRILHEGGYFTKE